MPAVRHIQKFAVPVDLDFRGCVVALVIGRQRRQRLNLFQAAAAHFEHADHGIGLVIHVQKFAVGM